MSQPLRPYLPTDADDLGVLYQAAIEELTIGAFDEPQRDAWMGRAQDEANWRQRLAACLTLVVIEDGEPIGFVSLAENRKIEHIYVHPDCAFLGVGTVLIDAIERLAQSRGATTLTVEAPDSAVAFFERVGFTALKRTTILHADQWLGGMTLEKKLGGEADAPPETEPGDGE